jgi:hypothetical protein
MSFRGDNIKIFILREARKSLKILCKNNMDSDLLKEEKVNIAKNMFSSLTNEELAILAEYQTSKYYKVHKKLSENRVDELSNKIIKDLIGMSNEKKLELLHLYQGAIQEQLTIILWSIRASQKLKLLDSENEQKDEQGGGDD